MSVSSGVRMTSAAHIAERLAGAKVAWAAGSAPFLPMLAPNVPDYIEAVTIFAHADKAGRDNAYCPPSALIGQNGRIE
jgi:hypothetical protein